MAPAPNFTPDEYRRQVEVMRDCAHLAPGNDPSPAFSFSSGLVAGMLMAAADRIEVLERIIADDPHKTEYWHLWCNVYDGPVAWDGRDAFEQIQHLQARIRKLESPP